MMRVYKPKIIFMLDYNSNPLWSNDEFTIQKFGYHIDNLKDLGLSSNTIELSKLVAKLYWDRLNPIYQGLPSFWSGEMHLALNIQTNVKPPITALQNLVGLIKFCKFIL